MSSLQNDRCLVVFTRFPREGQSKTRLALEVGHKNATELNKSFIYDILLHFCQRDFDLVIAGAESDQEAEFSELAEDYGSFDSFFLPDGDTMDEQIFSSYCWAFTRYKKAILTASDIPQLSTQHINELFVDLEDNDVVFHMNHDGGTCPQGMKSPFDLFTSMAHRSIAHCGEWKQLLRKMNLKHKMEPEILIDIDTLNDLIIFYHWQQLLPLGSGMFCPVTVKAIKNTLGV